jgi:hypothetical protein
MDLIPAETSLVVAGAWNIAILNPAWVQKYGLNKTEERVQVTIPAAAGGVLDFPRFTIGSLQYLIRPDFLQVIPEQSTKYSIDQTELFVSNILTELPHTR